VNDLERRLYQPLVWSLAVALAASGVALLVLMWTASFGPFRFLGSGRDVGAGFALWLPGGEAAANRWRLQAWRDAAPRDRAYFESESLEELARLAVGVVAVPDARALSRQDAVALRTFLDGGRGAILTGSVGVLGEAGRWRGYELMERLLETPAVRPLEGRPAGSLTAHARGPLSGRLRAGERVLVRPEAGVPSLAESGAELVWAGGDSHAASKRLEIGEGRLVWLGAGPESAAGGSAGRRVLTLVVQSAIDWASRRPMVDVLLWPRGAPLAGVVELDAGGTSAGRFVGTPEQVESRTRSDIAQAEATGGLALVELSLPALGIVEATRAEQFALAELRRARAWIADRGSVASWVGLQREIAARIERQGPSRLLLNVSNQAGSEARDIVLRIYLNEPAARVDVTRTQLLQGEPEIYFLPGRDSLEIALPPLPASAHRAYTVDFVPSAPG